MWVISVRLALYAATILTAIGLGACRPDPDVPATVALEDVYYHEFSKGKKTCLYDKDNRFWASSGREGFALKFSFRISDPNGIREFGYEIGDHIEGPYHTDEEEYLHNGPTLVTTGSLERQKAGFKGLHVKVTDQEGNTTQHDFTLDEIMKSSLPYILTVGDDECTD